MEFVIGLAGIGSTAYLAYTALSQKWGTPKSDHVSDMQFVTVDDNKYGFDDAILDNAANTFSAKKVGTNNWFVVCDQTDYHYYLNDSGVNELKARVGTRLSLS
jgi:hypothetical protein